jgi:hypothetical protein
MSAWLTRTVFTVVPSISKFMQQVEIDTMWPSLPFLSAMPLSSSLNRITLTYLNFAFFCQAFGLARQTRVSRFHFSSTCVKLVRVCTELLSDFHFLLMAALTSGSQYCHCVLGLPDMWCAMHVNRATRCGWTHWPCDIHMAMSADDSEPAMFNRGFFLGRFIFQRLSRSYQDV